MTPEEITDHLKKKFADAIVDADFQSAHPCAFVKPESWPAVARFLRDDGKLRFNMLNCVSSLDLLEDNQLVAIYDMTSMEGPLHSKELWKRRQDFCIKVRVPREKPEIPSVADVWPAADWHEREAYDLMGIVFTGHPDSVEDADGVHPRRILCADDWEGHPLRKDYLFPMEYHGIPAVTEYGQTRPQH